MRTLTLLLMIAAGVAAVLYCTVNLGMSWDDMTLTLESFIPRLISLCVYVWATVAGVAYAKHRNRDR